MAFRGNSTENVKNIDLDAEKNYFRSNNDGNFIGMVKLMAGENADLAEHIKKCKEKSSSEPTYLSKNFVNKALLCIKKYLVFSIVNEISRNGGCFGMLMDGTQDITCQEQYSVAVRYVDDNNDVVE